jgi:hypothetical protein
MLGVPDFQYIGRGLIPWTEAEGDMVHRSKRARVSGALRVHVTPELIRVVDQHVSQRRQTLSGFVRQAVVAALQAEGVDLSTSGYIEPLYTLHGAAESRMAPRQSSA